MSFFDDHDGAMTSSPSIRRRDPDDETIEALVAGRPVDERYEPLAAFVRQVRAVADLAAPPPSAALARMLQGEGVGGDVLPELASRRRRRAGSRLARAAGVGIAAKVALGASLAAAGVTGAGAVGVLPGGAGDAVRSAVEATTPIDFHSDSDDVDRGRGPDGGIEDGQDVRDRGDGTDQPAGFGDDVSDDATGASDGEPGVDGQQIADEAPGAVNRPTPDGSAGEGSGQTPPTGLPRADPTPPSTVPGSAPGTVPVDPGAAHGGGQVGHHTP